MPLSNVDVDMMIVLMRQGRCNTLALWRVSEHNDHGVGQGRDPLRIAKHAPKVVRDAALTLQSGAEFAKEVISKTPASVAWVQGYSASTIDSRWSRWCF